MFGSCDHVFDEGSKSSDAAIVPQSIELPSPPNTCRCPFAVPTAWPACAFSIGAPVVHVFVAGSKISIVCIGAHVWPLMRPPIA